MRRFLDLKTPLFIFGILAMMAFAFAVGLGVDRLLKWYRDVVPSHRRH